MANPITWRNIGAPDIGGAQQGLLGASQSFNSAIAALQGTLKGYEATDAANWQQGRSNNTNALMLKLAQLQDPATAQAQAAAAIGEAESMGAQVDLPSVLRAAQARPAELMDQQTKTWAFADAKRNQEDMPMMASVQELLAQGRDADALNVLNAARSTGALGDRNAMTLMAKARQVGQENLAADRAAQKHAMDLTGHQADLTLKAAQTNKLNADAAAERAKANGIPPALLQIAKDNVKSAQDAASSASGNDILGGTSVDSAAGRKELEAALKGTGIFAQSLRGETIETFPAKVNDKLKKLGSGDGNGNLLIKVPGLGGSVQEMRVPITTEMFKHALVMENGIFLDPGSTGVAERLQALAQSPDTLKALLGRQQAQARVSAAQGRLNALQEASLGNLGPLQAATAQAAGTATAVDTLRALAGKPQGAAAGKARD